MLSRANLKYIHSISRDIEDGDDDYESDEQILDLPNGTKMTVFPGLQRDFYRNLYQSLPDDQFARIGVLESTGDILLNSGDNQWEVFFQEPAFRLTELHAEDLFGDLQLEVFAAWQENYGLVDIRDHCSLAFLDDPAGATGVKADEVVFLQDGRIVTFQGHKTVKLDQLPERIKSWLSGL